MDDGRVWASILRGPPHRRVCFLGSGGCRHFKTHRAPHAASRDALQPHAHCQGLLHLPLHFRSWRLTLVMHVYRVHAWALYLM